VRRATACSPALCKKSHSLNFLFVAWRFSPRSFLLFPTRGAVSECYPASMNAPHAADPRPDEPESKLICHRPTGRFVNPIGEWTDKPDEAVNFPNFLTMITFCVKHHLRDVEAVLRFDQSKTELRCPCAPE